MSPGAKLGILVGGGVVLYALGYWLFLKLTSGGPKHDPTGPRGSDTWDGAEYNREGDRD